MTIPYKMHNPTGLGEGNHARSIMPLLTKNNSNTKASHAVILSGSSNGTVTTLRQQQFRHFNETVTGVAVSCDGRRVSLIFDENNISIYAYNYFSTNSGGNGRHVPYLLQTNRRRIRPVDAKRRIGRDLIEKLHNEKSLDVALKVCERTNLMS
mmetsp:Transcript_58425/g.69738  ORF Transcript_58425/g.69738 Transcript_58425/m.69738 type:complete len:153 (+) Transcript_58425:431-889(+)